MCVVSVFNQRAASCRFDVDGELIKQYLWCLHQLQHFVLPLFAPLRQTAAVSALELHYVSCLSGGLDYFQAPYSTVLFLYF